MTIRTIRLPKCTRLAKMRAASFDPATNTIKVIWTTGAPVRRLDPWTGEEYDEVLSLDRDAVRLDRLNAGAPLLDTHDSSRLDNVLGSVVPGTAKIESGKGTATVLLSTAPSAADRIAKIRDGSVRNVSVGYWTHAVEKTEGDNGGVAIWRVTDWEPLEISAVPIPADVGSQIRSDARPTRTCILTPSSSERRDFEQGQARFAALAASKPKVSRRHEARWAKVVERRG